MCRFTPHKFFIRYYLTFIAKRWYSLDMQSSRIDRKNCRTTRRQQSGLFSWTWCPRPRWGGTWTWSRARRLRTCARPGQDDQDDDDVVDVDDVDEDEAYIVPGVEVKENAGTVELPVEQKRKDIKKNFFTSHCSCSTLSLSCHQSGFRWADKSPHCFSSHRI